MFGLKSLSKKLTLPERHDALPGRADPMAVPPVHFVKKVPLTPPFPVATEQVVFGMGCFWGAERVLWQVPGVLYDRRGILGRLYTESDLP